MRLVLQRVSRASVTLRQAQGRVSATVDGRIISQIGKGYLLLLCVIKGDTEKEADWLAEKVTGLRLYDGPEGKVNDQSLLDVHGEALVVSQFTLAGDVKKGRRPDYTAAAAPAEAEALYGHFLQKMRSLGVSRVEGGSFGAHMQVELVNDGPVTLILDTSI